MKALHLTDGQVAVLCGALNLAIDNLEMTMRSELPVRRAWFDRKHYELEAEAKAMLRQFHSMKRSFVSRLRAGKRRAA